MVNIMLYLFFTHSSCFIRPILQWADAVFTIVIATFPVNNEQVPPGIPRYRDKGQVCVTLALAFLFCKAPLYSHGFWTWGQCKFCDGPVQVRQQEVGLRYEKKHCCAGFIFCKPAI